MADTDHLAAIRAAVLAGTFLRLTLTGAQRGSTVPWEKVTARPVQIRRGRGVQFSYFDGRKDITQNAVGEEIAAKLDELLALPFARVHVQTAEGDLHIRVTKKGRALVTRGKPSRPAAEADLAHDRTKQQPLRADRPDPFLQTIGIMDQNGRVRATRQGKFHQINEFLRALDPMLPEGETAPLEIVDCGCGNAYLTFAAYHYLNHLRTIPARVVGVDRNDEVLATCRRLQASLGWEGLSFVSSAIADYQPQSPPDIVLSLHACDTATDEALAQGVHWGSRVIMAAPCCQHELHDQLRAPSFRPVLRHGVLRQRLGDVLTDAFRALLLRIMGYQTEVIQFVDPEHTAKNLLLRARRGPAPGDARFVREYRELKELWQVTPALETLLGEGAAKVLARES